MSFFDEMLGHEESLFKNPGVLDENYLPKLLPYREDKQKYIAECIKRIEKGGTNLLIYGKPGVGKTASVRHVFRELKMKNNEILPIYINLWQNRNFYEIIRSLRDEVGVRSRIKDKERLAKIVFKKLSDYKGLAIAFDEIDKPKNYSFLYRFLEEFRYKTMFLITTKENWFASLDDRLRSRLTPERSEFQPYSYEETKGILKKRIENGFVKNVWGKDAFNEVVSVCFKAKDIRVGLSLMKQSANIAEEEASRKILKKHVEKVVSKEKEDKEEKTSLKSFS